MFYPRTERQTRFIQIAEELAEKFAQRAPKHDRAGSFPFANFDDIRRSGLPALVIPTEYGGWGANALETVMTMETLAIGDGSSALNATMHMQTMGGAAQFGHWPEHLFAHLCTEAVERGALVNAIATEPELGSPSRGGRPKTTAKPIYENGSSEPTAWILNGRKNFASMSPTLDYMIIMVALEDGSEQIGHFAVAPSEGLEIIETWDAMGMRATGSHDVLLTDVRVPSRYFIPPSSKKKKIGVNAWFPLTVSAVYVGVAMAAHRAAIQYACERVPTGLGKPIAEVETIQRRLGDAELLLHQARFHLYHTADLWDQYPEQRAKMGSNCMVAKYTATNNAVQAVDLCMRVVGGASMSKALPLERHYRDVRGGLSHPPNDDMTLITLGKQAIERVQEVKALV